MVSLTELFATYQSNVTEGMVQLLADDLNVSPKAIKALGVGFWPHKQAWIFAQRNAKGDIIGLATRYMNGKKAMVGDVGSTPGLTYILNPAFKGSPLRGPNLLDDFVRTADAKVKCPICGKPDWCLVSRNDPNDPAEVICKRPEYKKEGSRQWGSAGWMHILDKERARSSYYQKGAGPLLPSNKPYLVVEGASDVLAAYDLGFVGIGKPNNLGGHGLLGTLIRGKQVVILGENDGKKNAKGIWVHPGKEGMELTFDKIHGLCDAVKVMPLTGIKDLRKWLKHGVTGSELLEYIKANADIKIEHDSKDSKTKNEDHLKDPLPQNIAKQWYKEVWMDGIYKKLRYHCGKWWEWTGALYELIEQSSLDQKLDEYLDERIYVKTKETKKGTVTEQEQCDGEFKARGIKYKLKCIANIRNKDNTLEPFVIQEYQDQFKFDREKQIIFKNGVLDIETGGFVPLTPELFITSTIPYDYDPGARCLLWLQTLNDWWGNDDDSIRLLQQWFGYNLISTNYLEAMMILFGISRSGKSTVTRVLHEILGDKCRTLKFRDLSYTFGMEKIINRNAIVFSEDQLTKRADAGLVLETFKQITGGDMLSVSVKYGDSLDVKPFARITYGCNTMPRFADDPQALADRLNILVFGRSFTKNTTKPNRRLKSQLMKEIPGIINWALEGLRDLQRTNEFVVPKISEVAQQEFQYVTSTLAAMGSECLCFDDPTAWTSTDQLFDLHREWCKESGDALNNRIWFGRKIIQAFPKIKHYQKSIESGRTHGYKGVSILPEAASRYLNSPSS